nr:immunoglobulin heavy chain junction region [Macaca mulatta]MOW24242.1 immunoglobulin heavy chain junction region [Macaca mulatta]
CARCHHGSFDIW